MTIEEFLYNDENWLNAEWIECPACRQPLFRIDRSPLDNSTHFYCDRCPVRIEVIPYGTEYEQIEQSFVPSRGDDEQEDDAYGTAFMRAIEARLKPCTCGGTFRYDAARHCFSCFAPVVTDDPFDVDLYPNEDGFENELDPERQERWNRWQAQFLPEVENKWKDGDETEQ
jgi:hypothetical protein